VLEFLPVLSNRLFEEKLMEVSSGSPPPKRARAKSKEPAKLQSEAKPVIASKKPRAASRKVAIPEAVTMNPEPNVRQAPSSEELSGLIATAAYFIAAERGFGPGHELDDWLEAERLIRTNLFG
jgi:hypothetical protein